MPDAALATIWFGLLGLILAFYVMLDGFDLGVGVLALFVKDEGRRGIMMGSLGTVWDANETWLVLFGGIIFGAFPVVYGLVMMSLYVPLVLMLVGLIFRAVSFEFRAHSANKRLWSSAFGWGSLLAAVCQGLAFGGLIGGVQVQGTRFVGGVFDWVDPFSLVTAVELVSGYVLLGSLYLVMKTDGELRETARKSGVIAGIVTLVFAGLITLWAGLRFPFVAEKWFRFPGFLVTLIPMEIAVIAFAVMMYSLAKRFERAPFIWSLAFIFFGFIATTANFYPYIVPPSITISDAAAQPIVLERMLDVVAIFIPLLIAFNAFQYWTFRGKVKGNVYEE